MPGNLKSISFSVLVHVVERVTNLLNYGWVLVNTTQLSFINLFVKN